MKTCRDHLDLIETVSKKKWGESWLLELVKRYIKFLKDERGEEAILNNRISTIKRAFEVGSCTADTLLGLYDAAGCSLEVRMCI